MLLGVHTYRVLGYSQLGEMRGAVTPDKGSSLRDGEFLRVFKHLAKR